MPVDNALISIASSIASPVLILFTLKFFFTRFINNLDEKFKENNKRFDKIDETLESQRDEIDDIKMKMAVHEAINSQHTQSRSDLESLKEKVILLSSSINAAWRILDRGESKDS